MAIGTNIKQNLINVDDSVLIVIDIQDHFLAKYDNTISQPVVEKASWMVKLAGALDQTTESENGENKA